MSKRPNPDGAALTRALDARDELLRVAGHELKTPLAAVQLQLDGLVRLTRRGGASPDRLVDKAQRAAFNVRRLGRLIDRLMDVSRLLAGRLALAVEPMDLTDAVAGVVDRHQAAADAAGCVLRLRTHGAIPGDWDRARIEQVAEILIEHAIARAANAPIDVHVSQTDTRAELVVADGGAALTEAETDRIFAPFERALERDGGELGLGIGLWVMRQIVEQHGGTLTVDATPERGARFTVALPAA